jgi:two-component system phosphate regulon response regulator OmpR
MVDDLPHILVVDDDRRIRNLLQAFLMENGFRISVAGSAVEAREHMRIVSFDLVVLDIMMPGETGLAFTEWLRAEGNPVPILMLSALAEASDRIAGLETGSDDYLAKPFEPRELLLRIRGLLKRQEQVARGQPEVAFGPFIFHVQRGELRRGAELIRLTTREREFLRTMPTTRWRAATWRPKAPRRARAAWMSRSTGCARRSRTIPRIPSISRRCAVWAMSCTPTELV